MSYKELYQKEKEKNETKISASETRKQNNMGGSMPILQ